MKLPPLMHRLGKSVIRNPLPGFDPDYYRHWYRDVTRSPSGALAHYLDRGWKEGRDPSAGFSTDGYLAANPDVAAIDICPLVHFLEHGLAEGRVGWKKDLRIIGAPMRATASRLPPPPEPTPSPIMDGPD